jgi:hypothetical protein
MSKQLHCPQCGRKVEPDWNFCTRCGQQLRDVSKVRWIGQKGGVGDGKAKK